MSQPSPENCATCPVHNVANLVKLGVDMENYDYVVALAGNPNTGKSTVFNALTGSAPAHRQLAGQDGRAGRGRVRGRGRPLQARRPARHVLAAVGESRRGDRARLHPLRPAGRHRHRRRRHASGAQSQPRAAGAGDHGSRRRLPQPHGRGAAQGPRDRRAPARPRPGRARRAHGRALRRRPRRAATEAISDVAAGRTVCKPRRAGARAPALEKAVTRLAARVEAAFPGLPNARWVALRLLDGDRRIAEAVRSGELGELRDGGQGLASGDAPRGPDSRERAGRSRRGAQAALAGGAGLPPDS